MSRFELGDAVVWNDNVYIVEGRCEEPTVFLRGLAGRPTVAASKCRAATAIEAAQALVKALPEVET